MGRFEKILQAVLEGRADANIDFDDLCSLRLQLGFAQRTRGSHHIFSRAGVEELLNLQRAGPQAKPYQVRQVRRILRDYRLELQP